MCGEYPGDKICDDCSFDHCLGYAEYFGPFAFAYRGTSQRWCRKCDKVAFDWRVKGPDWGIYVKGTIRHTYTHIYQNKYTNINACM